MARGDEQIYGVDFTCTFSASLVVISSKQILAVSRIRPVPAHHGDVPSAYVKADMEASLEIFLHIPQGLELTTRTYKYSESRTRINLLGSYGFE